MPYHHIHNTTPLTKELSWKLLCIHDFLGLEERNPPHELTNITNHVVDNFFGLLLAFKTIGGYMAIVRRTPNDWKQVLDRLNEEDPMKQGYSLSKVKLQGFA